MQTRLLPFLRMFMSCSCLITAEAASSQPASKLVGTWTLDLEHSDEVPAWRRMELVVSTDADGLTLTRNLGWGRRRFSDSVTIRPGTGATSLPLEWWADNRHLGVYASDEHERSVEAEWLDDGRTLRTESRFTVETQQGTAPMRIVAEYRLWPDGNRLTLIELRSSRQDPITYSFTRAP